MISNPVAGALSDRTTGRSGGGTRGRWAARWRVQPLVLLAGQHTIAGVITGWCLAQAGLNAMQASVTAGVPDHVPVAQRGLVSGWRAPCRSRSPRRTRGSPAPAGHRSRCGPSPGPSG